MLLLFSCEKNTNPAASFPLRKAYECKKDSDCLLSCKTLTNCCDRPCICSRAYNRKFFKKNFASVQRYHRKQRRCETTKCPPVVCPKLTYRVTAQCYHGRCRAKIHHDGVKKFDWKKYHGHGHKHRKRPSHRGHKHTGHKHTGHKHTGHKDSKKRPAARRPHARPNLSLPPRTRPVPRRSHDHDHDHH